MLTRNKMNLKKTNVLTSFSYDWISKVIVTETLSVLALFKLLITSDDSLFLINCH